MIPTRQLIHVVALANHQNFRRAAQELKLTQPALSRSIQSLEGTLGARLFDRGHGGVEPTATGQLVVDRAREILSGIAGLEHEVKLLQGLGSGTLDISLGPYPSALSGKLAVARFVATYSEIQCRVRVAGYREVADDVANSRCEVGIADVEFATEHGLITEVVVDRPVYFFARPRHPLAVRRRCTLADLMNYPWAAIRFPMRASRHLPEDVGRAGHWDPETREFVPALEANVVSDFLGLAHESNILVAATLTMAQEELMSRMLCVLPFAKPWFRLLYGFISRPNHSLSPATLRFMEIVREIEVDIEAREKALREKYL